MAFRIAIFASGSGSNAENIVRFFSDSGVFVFPIIVSNKADAYVHVRANQLGIPSYTFDRSEFVEGVKVLDLLERERIDYIVLAGFLLKMPLRIILKYPNRIVNVHPALLPKYGGKGMYGKYVHEAVVDARETQTGITIHYINEHYDEGAIIFQISCPVLPDDTPEEVADKVHQLEYIYYPKIIAEIWGGD